MRNKRKAAWSIPAVSIPVLSLLLLLFLAILPACSSQEETPLDVKEQGQIVPKRVTPPPAKTPATGSPGVSSPAETSPGIEMNMTPLGLNDKGTPCKSHRYFVSPGVSETLPFEIYLSNQKLKEINLDSLELVNNRWSDYGLGVSIGKKEIITFSVSYPVWGIDGSEYLEELRAAGKDATFTTIEDKGLGIRWRADNFGVIMRIREYGNAVDIGKFTEKEILDQLNGQSIIEYNDKNINKVYSWALQQGKEEKEYEILVIDISVNVPLEPIAGVAGEKSLRLQVDSFTWWLTVSYSQAEKMFIFEGPGETRECFEKIE